MVHVTFPDGTKKKVKDGMSVADVIKEHIGEGLLRAALAAKLDDRIVDLDTPVTKDATFRVLTFKDEEGKEVFWHSSAHLLAMAVLDIWPDAQLTIGPAIEQGFYYDFYKKEPFTQEDLAKIEKKMKEFVDKDIPFKKVNVSYADAKKRIGKNEFKQELLDEYKDEQLSFYETGNFQDLCRGPHIPSTGHIKAFKLTGISASYWRGDAENASLQRIYGISFPDKKELKKHLQMMEEAAKRDHRKIGKDLDLYMVDDLSPGSPFFLPKGTIVYNELKRFIQEEYHKRGYKEVITPQMFNKKLWETSGHWEHYREDMFLLDVDGQEFSLKPMNCPSHVLIYKRDAHSYRDLPLRIADFGMLHRNELKGVLGGLTRVRKFAQDDAHIFCTEDQIEDEVFGVLEFFKYVWEEVFDFKLTYYLSTRPEKALGDKKIWEKSEKQLAAALEKAGISYEVKEGDGAFYGPKIDIDLTDAFGRKWQCPTCQLDFNMPARFGAEYEGADGKKHQVVMIHRAVLGSLERFMAMLIEHCAGKFPLWLSPVQVKLLPIADRHHEYCQKLWKQMNDAGLRVEIDDHALTVNKKVRNAQLEQVNYILVVGDKEVENKTVNVRTRENKVLGEKKVDSFLEELEKEKERKEKL
jgi:threonyl-tRNA synthetase